MASQADHYHSSRLPPWTAHRTKARLQQPRGYYENLFRETRGLPPALRARALSADVAAFADRQRDSRGRETKVRLSAVKDASTLRLDDPELLETAQAKQLELREKLHARKPHTAPADDRVATGDKRWWYTAHDLRDPQVPEARGEVTLAKQSESVANLCKLTVSQTKRLADHGRLSE